MLSSRISEGTYTILGPWFPPRIPLLQPPPPVSPSTDIAKPLRLEDELALLVLLARLVRLVVLPPDRLLALPARNVPHNVPPRRHVALARLARVDVDHRVEEVCLAVLAAEVLRGWWWLAGLLLLLLGREGTWWCWGARES